MEVQRLIAVLTLGPECKHYLLLNASANNGGTTALTVLAMLANSELSGEFHTLDRLDMISKT